MPSPKIQFYNEGIFHINLRAVGNDIIFKDKNDYYRGIYSLYEFNNSKSVTIKERRRQREIFKKRQQNSRCPTPGIEEDKRDRFVDILTFCFMPNHVHLVVKQLKENGISNFMKKVGGGYANYFNLKYKRRGHLFNRFKPVHIETDEQLKNALVYDWVNPVSIIEPGWKDCGIKDFEKVANFIKEEYRWSSFFDCVGKTNFPSVTNIKFLREFIGGETACYEAMKSWISYKGSVNLENSNLE